MTIEIAMYKSYIEQGWTPMNLNDLVNTAIDRDSVDTHTNLSGPK